MRADAVCLDRGGGGKQVADELRSRGHNVRTVAFGEAVGPEPRVGTAQLSERVDQKEERYAYVNRRAQMYGLLREYLDPVREETPGAVPAFAMPAGAYGPAYARLRQQLAVMPLLYDKEGRLRMPPKRRTPGTTSAEKSLEELIGHSPDEADAVVLALYAMTSKPRKVRVGVS